MSVLYDGLISVDELQVCVCVLYICIHMCVCVNADVRYGGMDVRCVPSRYAEFVFLAF
jgi:hypothetical protein